MPINIGGLKQSAAMARIECAITKEEFSFVCEMEVKKEINISENHLLKAIVRKVNAWYFS